MCRMTCHCYGYCGTSWGLQVPSSAAASPNVALAQFIWTARRRVLVSTIESLATDQTLAPVQQAWIDEQVSQCGYCQPGILMAVDALLSENPQPDDETIDKAVTNICRCGTYPRIRRAIHRAAELRSQTAKTEIT